MDSFNPEKWDLPKIVRVNHTQKDLELNDVNSFIYINQIIKVWILYKIINTNEFLSFIWKERRMYLYIKIIVLFIFISILLPIPHSISTSVKEMSLKDLCKSSNEIVIARVIDLQSYLISDKNRIYTKINIEVEESIKGNLKSKEQFTLSIYGGTMNGITTFVVGGPQFSPGENIILFLKQFKDSIATNKGLFVAGLSQGKFNIIEDEKTKLKMVIRDQCEKLLLSEKDNSTILLTSLNAISLSDFLQYINNYK